MDNLGDWIYILFILIAFITSVLKPKKRSEKANRPLTPAVPASSGDSSDSRWRELTARRRRPVLSPPPFSAEPAADPYERRNKSTTSPKKEIKTDACYQIDENAYGETDEDKIFRDQVDLRKAVIASEILARKF